MRDGEQYLVPGRSCGECHACCEAPAINGPELKKLPGVLCSHCVPGQGCAIHEKRPALCRDWFCGWRVTATLDDSWRPDRCGVMLVATTQNIPSGYPAQGVILDLTGPSDQPVRWPPLVEAVAQFLSTGVPIFLSVPGPPGFTPGKVFLNGNSGLRAALAAGDGGQFARELLAAFAAASRTPMRPARLG